MTRRDFAQMAGLAAVGSSAGCATAARTTVSKNEHDFMWAYLIHLGTNTMCDRVPKEWGSFPKDSLHGFAPSAKLRCDDATWREVVDAHVKAGTNTVVIGLAEGVVYPSHPELAIEGSWSPEKLRAEIARLRAQGVEVIPKLNFSATHDVWMGEYGRMLATRKYYEVSADLIRDVWEMFDGPRMIHLGYDEENWENQCRYEYAVIRQGELWWHDFLWFVGQVEKLGMQAWIWTDCNRKDPETFYRRMPKSVVQSNWYYGKNFNGEGETAARADTDRTRLGYYADFSRAGFQQIPCGSNWYVDGNFPALARYCQRHVSKTSLRGMLTAPWFKTVPANRAKLLGAAAEMAEAIRGCQSGKTA
ncbi:MAG TPA: hypothetical protein PKI32_02825 [Opitutales bacterium]|nr:hypothetical protein [Opitutales bacterium]